LLLGLEGAAGNADASPTAGEADLASSPAPSRPKRRQRDEPRWPSDLPVLEEVIEPAEVKAEPQDWRCIGAEISDQLDYEPAHFLVRRLIRRKFVHRTQEDATPVIAELPEKLQERGIAAPGLLAQIIVAKYCWPPSPLSAGTDLCHPPSSHLTAANAGHLDGDDRLLAATHLRDHAHHRPRRRLRASR